MGELGVPLWQRVRGADGLTGWAGCSTVRGADGLTGWAGCSNVRKGQKSWLVDWVTWVLHCDKGSEELMGWLYELGAPLWPRSDELMCWLGELAAPLWERVRGADWLTGWAGCSTVTDGQPGADGMTGWPDCSTVTMTKGERSWWVDWVSWVLCFDQGQRSWWVDWVSWVLCCDQGLEELMGWLGELDAPLWPMVRGADGLTGWAGCSAVTKG